MGPALLIVDTAGPDWLPGSSIWHPQARRQAQGTRRRGQEAPRHEHCAVLPKTLKGKRGLIPSELRNFASCDKARSTQYRETLYRYLTYNRSPKATCKALCTHSNTVLCRIRKIR